MHTFIIGTHALNMSKMFLVTLHRLLLFLLFVIIIVMITQT